MQNVKSRDILHFAFCILHFALRVAPRTLRFTEVVLRIETALKAPLPGPAAHELLAPRPRRSWPVGFNPARIRNAAGPLLVFPAHEDAHLVLTLRARTPGR